MLYNMFYYLASRRSSPSIPKYLYLYTVIKKSPFISFLKLHVLFFLNKWKSPYLEKTFWFLLQLYAFFFLTVYSWTSPISPPQWGPLFLIFAFPKLSQFLLWLECFVWEQHGSQAQNNNFNYFPFYVMLQ